MGYIDEEGYLHISGRKDYLFKYKAEKIFPEEIEKIFLNIKSVKDVIVIPYTRNEHEKVPVVFIKPDRYFNKNLNYIKETIKKELPAFRLPRFFLKWPYTEDSLKPSRIELKNGAGNNNTESKR